MGGAILFSSYRFFPRAQPTTFGSNYQAAMSVGRSSTTSPAFQTKLTLVTPVLTGTYRIGWFAVVDTEQANGSVLARLRDVTAGVTLGAIQQLSPAFVDDTYPVGGFREVTLNNEAKTYAIQFSRQAGGGPPYTVGIQDAHLEIWRVG
jgi:hypothetical protein